MKYRTIRNSRKAGILLLPHLPDEDPDQPETGSDDNHENVEDELPKTVMTVSRHVVQPFVRNNNTRNFVRFALRPASA